jgi:hypothetical protein
MSWLRACCLLVLAALTGCAGLGPVSPPAPDSRFRELARLVGTDPESGPGFAAELAAYRADPAYACRRPAFAYYFAHRFGQTLDYRACPATVPFFLLDRDRGGYLVRVAPSRVRRIHIMFATAGDGVASRFGHVSLRLVVCPDVGASDQACDENLLQHVVLGYVARVNEFHLSLVKGVLGGYDAHLSGFSFMEAYRANTLLADRDIYSVPLRLTSEQTEQIVRELSEIHWSFRGDYRFFTNNCATLLQDTLAAALAGAAEPEALAAGYLRPDAFFSALRDSDLVQYDVLNSLTEAERRGYFFRSARPYYQQAFETVRQAPGWSGPDSLQAYLATPARERRLQLLTSDRLLTTYARDRHAWEAQVLLEEKALMSLADAQRHSVLALVAEEGMVARLERYVSSLPDHDDRQLLAQCYLRPLARFRQRLPVSAGIPGPDFLDRYPVPSATCADGRNLHRARQLLTDWLPADHDAVQRLRIIDRELEQTHENLAQLRAM